MEFGACATSFLKVVQVSGIGGSSSSNGSRVGALWKLWKLARVSLLLCLELLLFGQFLASSTRLLSLQSREKNK